MRSRYLFSVKSGTFQPALLSAVAKVWILFPLSRDHEKDMLFNFKGNKFLWKCLLSWTDSNNESLLPSLLPSQLADVLISFPLNLLWPELDPISTLPSTLTLLHSPAYVYTLLKAFTLLESVIFLSPPRTWSTCRTKYSYNRNAGTSYIRPMGVIGMSQNQKKATQYPKKFSWRMINEPVLQIQKRRRSLYVKTLWGHV